MVSRERDDMDQSIFFSAAACSKESFGSNTFNTNIVSSPLFVQVLSLSSVVSNIDMQFNLFRLGDMHCMYARMLKLLLFFRDR